ncbi:hypothetical protein, partial [Pseudoalteromonas sp.]|uniref:hypothetical protein n=1 Tax=Pseudoalteromonas sp. TaxID=53249 RepID=UPI00263A3C23
VGYVSDPFDVTLTSNAGSIIGLDTEGVNVQTLDLTMDAAVAIVGESGTSFTTDADTIYAYASELIDIYDVGEVTFAEVINEGGMDLRSIYLTSEDTMRVGHINDPFDVTLTSYNGSIVGLRQKKANVRTKELTLDAAKSIRGKNGESFTTNAKEIYAYANKLIDIYDKGKVTFAEVINLGDKGDSVYLTSKDNMKIGYVYDPKHVTLRSLYGNIKGLKDYEVNIETAELRLYAPEGAIYGKSGRTAHALATDISSLWAYADEAIAIYNASEKTLTLEELFANSLVAIGSEGDLEINSVEAQYVALASYGGDLIGLDNDDDANISADTI